MVNFIKQLALEAANAILDGLMHLGKFTKTLAEGIFCGIQYVGTIGEAVLANKTYILGTIGVLSVVYSILKLSRHRSVSNVETEPKVESTSTHEDGTVRSIVDTIKYIIKEIGDSYWSITSAFWVVDMIVNKFVGYKRKLKA